MAEEKGDLYGYRGSRWVEGVVIFMNKITRQSKLEKKKILARVQIRMNMVTSTPTIFDVIWLWQIQRVTQREAQAMTSRFTLILCQGF